MLKRFFFIAFVLVAARLAATDFVFAQDDPIRWSIKPPEVKGAIRPGDKFSVKLTAEIDAGWHLYSISQPSGGPIPTRITLPPDQPFKIAGKIISPDPLVAHDPNFDIDTEYYAGSAVFTLPLKVDSNAAAGKTRLQVTTFFQSCNDELCLPPKTVKLEIPIEITADARKKD